MRGAQRLARLAFAVLRPAARHPQNIPVAEPSTRSGTTSGRSLSPSWLRARYALELNHHQKRSQVIENSQRCEREKFGIDGRKRRSELGQLHETVDR